MKPAPKTEHPSYNPYMQHTGLFASVICTPRSDLATDIVRVIVLREKRNLQMKCYGYGILAIGALVFVVPASVSVGKQLAESGFFHYASLAFSDAQVIAPIWKQFGLVIAESVPGISIALAVGGLFVFGWATKRAVKSIYQVTLRYR